MAFTVTLLEMKTRAKERADMVNSNFISPDELTSLINESYSDLYDDMVTSNEDYFITEYPFTLASGESSLSVPSNFYKIRGVDRLTGSNAIPLKRYSWSQRGVKNYYNGATGGYANYMYRLTGDEVSIIPKNSAPGDYTLWYVKTYVKLVDDADTIDSVNGWEKIIILDTAIKMLTKEESDTSALERERAEKYQRIMNSLNERDLAQPKKIQKESNNNPEDFFGRRF